MSLHLWLYSQTWLIQILSYSHRNVLQKVQGQFTAPLTYLHVCMCVQLCVWGGHAIRCAQLCVCAIVHARSCDCVCAQSCDCVCAQSCVHMIMCIYVFDYVCVCMCAEQLLDCTNTNSKLWGKVSSAGPNKREELENGWRNFFMKHPSEKNPFLELPGPLNYPESQ